MVYVLAQDGTPLMPTKRYGKVRHLLEDGRAKVVKRTPFTIQLLYPSVKYVQPVTLGVDAGSKHIGLSATAESEELYASDVELRNDIAKKLSSRRAFRRARRSRKTRYRKARFQNRRKPEGWLAPSVQNKIRTHWTVIRQVCEILPVSQIVVETASFDIQKIKNPEISGKEYQQGEQLGFWNVREYVLCRDGHTCQCCHGKSKDPVLNVHHIESRQTGGNAPNNLITLCETCHKGYHQGKIQLPKTIHRGMSFRHASFMGIMRWALLDQLKAQYLPQGIAVRSTYGYLTKNTRVRYGLPKEHYVDARCISGHPTAKPLGYVFYQKKVRCHNRQLHKATIRKGGVRQRNQSAYEIHGYHLFDRVQYRQREYFLFGKRTSGYFDIRTLDGAKVNKGSVSYKKLQPLEYAKHYLQERREMPIIPHLIEDKVPLANHVRNINYVEKAAVHARGSLLLWCRYLRKWATPQGSIFTTQEYQTLQESPHLDMFQKASLTALHRGGNSFHRMIKELNEKPSHSRGEVEELLRKHGVLR